MKRILGLLLIFLALEAYTYPVTMVSNVDTLINGSFEVPNIGAGNFQGNPAGASWTWTPVTGNVGIASNGSAFNNPTAVDGTQVNFLQKISSFSQTLNFSGGMYTLSYYACQRPGNTQTFEILIDSTVVETRTPGSTSFVQFTTSAFAVSAGNHTITFSGLDPGGGDQTVFIDLVVLTK